jgi:hypothetical protein
VRYAKVSDGDRSFYSLAAVVRLDRAITPNQTAFPVAPQLEDGQEVGDVFGGNPASLIGSPLPPLLQRELQRPQPVATPRQGARWRLGVSQGNTVQDTVSVTLKRPAEDGWEREAARRLGCYASSGSDADDGLVGKRVPVRVDQLLLYENPARSYVGSLVKGQTFKVRRLSPSGKYAYGRRQQDRLGPHLGARAGVARSRSHGTNGAEGGAPRRHGDAVREGATHQDPWRAHL